MPRRIGLVPAVAVVVASMIGVGVFTTTGFLLRDLGSPLAVLTAWALGGLLALCGALSYAELGAALPQNGGEYQLLSRIYHPAVGFIAGWVSLVVGFSAPIAAVAIAFGLYAARVVPGIPPDVAALAAIGIFSAFHAARVSLGTAVHSAVTAIEVLLVVVFIAGGFFAGAPERLSSEQSTSFGHAVLSPAFAVGLIYVSFSYSGWNAAAYIAGEVQNPGRTLPRALLIGTSLVTLLYVAINAVFLMAAPARDLVGVVEIGHVGAVALFGPTAGRLLSGIILFCLFASVGAQLMTGARVYEAMGRDYAALRVLARRGAKTGPIAGIFLQAGIASVMALTASFDGLLTYIGFTLSLSALLTVLGVFVLRRREPILVRPYRTAGYPVTPLLAVAIMAWMALYAVIERPSAALAGVATLALGATLYVAVSRVS